MILSDVDIQAEIKKGEIVIEVPPGTDPLEFEPASYDLHVGNQAIVKQKIVDLQREKFVIIPRGETVVIYPREKIGLGTTLAARFGLVSRYARRGLILLSGPQIDPGFNGWLEITVFNTGNHAVRLLRDEKFATIEFMRLSSPASRAYNGRFQNQRQVTPDVLETIQSRHLKSFAEYEDDVRRLKVKFGVLQWFVYTILGGAVFAILTELFNQWIGTKR